ncbi:hypothetical protein CLCY_7c00870 [Clostridium cylindrosporum DSM 605]|uniref:Uncharacterized protein n=1 Tax=Clostridium cylindrosporum DSM 605 TaxID=1121307 RepID=A0A0J8DAI7_CLOCY|nr:hypothetical protein CLCY_7c00870 [Clostridium cylindrosporum DSM 605]
MIVRIIFFLLVITIYLLFLFFLIKDIGLNNKKISKKTKKAKKN